MPTFTIRRSQDAYVQYVAEVEAPTIEDAVDRAYEGQGIVWEEAGVVEFDACRVVAVDDDGEEIESYVRGKG